MLFYIAIIILMIPCSLFFPIKKIGKQNYKKLKGQNYIISCNHMSNMDPIMLDIKFNKKHRILAKKELFKNKFISKCLNSLGAIKVDRGSADAHAVKGILSALNKKQNIMIFPQGTRAKTVKIEDGSAKEGVALFSIRTGTPVIPMMFDKKIKSFRKTKLYIGEPIYPDVSRKKDKDYIAEFANLIVEKMNALIDENVIKKPKKLKHTKRVKQQEAVK